MITSIEFLKRHSYSIKGMTEKDAEDFIISNGTSKFSVFKYMKKRAKFLISRRAKNEQRNTNPQRPNRN